MLDGPVYGRGGGEVDKLKDIFIGEDGRVDAIMVEAGGVIGIGDAAVRIPWAEVTLTDNRRLVVGVAEGSLPEFEGEPKPGLIGSYTPLEGTAAYGRVADVVFDRDGAVTAVTIEPSYGHPSDGVPPFDYEAIDIDEYKEVDVDPATGELVIEWKAGGDKAQPGDLGGIHIER